ncbi:MAG: discoidin domain-containing protein, partial [Thermoleophilia bacterium]
MIERATADFPRRSGEAIGPAFAADALDMVDSEQGMRRIVTLPVRRGFVASGWASLRPAASDASIDRLVGSSYGARYTSSSRFEGLGRYRASSAFDGSSLSSWQAEYDPANRPWLQVTRAQPMLVRELKLVPARGRHLKPQVVAVGTPAGSFTVKVNNDGTVRLPRAISTRSLRVTIDRVA